MATHKQKKYLAATFGVVLSVIAGATIAINRGFDEYQAPDGAGLVRVSKGPAGEAVAKAAGLVKPSAEAR